MLVELKNNLQTIYNDVMTNLAPLNLRKDISLLGIDGWIRQGNKFRTTTQTAITNISVESVSGAQYGFSLNANGYYESTNKAVSSSAAVCKLKFIAHGTTTLTLSCINYAESSYDFGLLSQLDKTLTLTNTTDTDAYFSFSSKQSADIQQVTYSVPKGEHFIYIKYKKDSSVDSNNDSLQFKVTDIGRVTDFYDEIVTVPYYTTTDMFADMTQPTGTIGIIMTPSFVISALYQFTENNTWELLLDVSGTIPKTFSTIQEMEENKHLPENTLAIVYGTSYIGTYKLDKGEWTQIGDSTAEAEIMNILNEVEAVIDEYEGTGGTDEQINYTFDGILGTLPYTLLTYIRATNAQYIDTGIPMATDLEIDIEYELDEKAGGQCILGESAEGWNVYGSGFCGDATNFGIAYTGNPQLIGGTSSAATRIDAQEHAILKITNTHVIYNGVRYNANIDSATGNPYDVFKNKGGNLWLLHDAMWEGFSNAKVYKFKVSKAGTVIMNLVPVEKKDTKEVCMYDTVSQTYFLNQGEGSFNRI